MKIKLKHKQTFDYGDYNENNKRPFHVNDIRCAGDEKIVKYTLFG